MEIDVQGAADPIDPPEGLLDLNERGERLERSERRTVNANDRHRHDLSADGRSRHRGGRGRPRGRARAARRGGPRSARVHDRSAPQRGRCAVWRRTGNGDEARAAAARGRAHPRDARGAGAVVLLSPQGRPFTQAEAERFGRLAHIVLLCGRYEGMDERVRELVATDELSIGDYVLSGGELPALVVVDAVSRLVPGVVGDEQSVDEDSFSARSARLPALHAAGGSRRDAGAGRAAVGAPCGGAAVAAEGGAGADAGAAAGAAGDAPRWTTKSGRCWTRSRRRRSHERD